MAEPSDPSVNILRRQAHDCVQRLRQAFSVNDAALLPKLDRSTVEYITEGLCHELGLRYYPPPDVPRRQDGRASPWAPKNPVRPKK